MSLLCVEPILEDNLLCSPVPWYSDIPGKRQAGLKLNMCSYESRMALTFSSSGLQFLSTGITGVSPEHSEMTLLWRCHGDT